MPATEAPHWSNSQNSIISFGYVDFYAEVFLILYTPFENSTTRIAIMCTMTADASISLIFFNKLLYKILHASSWCSHTHLHQHNFFISLLLENDKSKIMFMHPSAQTFLRFSLNPFTQNFPLPHTCAHLNVGAFGCTPEIYI